MRFIGLLPWISVFTLFSCTELGFDVPCAEEEKIDPAPHLTKIESQREIWQRQRPVRYSMLQTHSCFCGAPWSLSSVSGETVTAFISGRSYGETPTSATGKGATVESVFDRMTEEVRQKPIRFEATYDPENGRPIDFSGEGLKCTSDTYYGTHAEFLDIESATGVSHADDCTAESLPGVDGVWEVETAPEWEMGYIPVTAVVKAPTSSKLFNPYTASVRLYTADGTFYILLLELWPNASERWCATRFFNGQTFVSVRSETNWILWNPSVVEQEGSLQRQWRFRRPKKE